MGVAVWEDIKIRNELHKRLKEEINDSSVTVRTDSDFYKDLGFKTTDSLNEFVSDVESFFEINISYSKVIEDVKTFNDLVELIENTIVAKYTWSKEKIKKKYGKPIDWSDD